MSMNERLTAKYRPIFARIAAGVLDRECERVLPFEPVAWLKEAGFTAVRVPVAQGGDGATLPELCALLVELAAADPHVTQAFRGHIGFVEDRLYAGDEAWMRRFVNGEMVGNAVTEVGAVVVGEVGTKLTAVAGGYEITGRKFYSTGSIFAEWIDATALRPDGVEVAALVSTASDQVRVSDDWTGFGQRLTGSGAAMFDAAPVAAEHVYVFADRVPYQTALYQLVLVAVQAGIARAAARDAADQVAHRSRTFSHGNAARTRDDAQILEIVGSITADAFAAEAIVVRAAEWLQRSYDAREVSGTSDGVAPDAVIEGSRSSGSLGSLGLQAETELASAQAQIVVGRLAIDAATRLFDALGASATSTSLALDRHWRNARTVASHNPVAFKQRIVGDAVVNGAEPPYEWTIGVPAAGSATVKAGIGNTK